MLLSFLRILQCQLWHTCILLLIWQIWRLIIPAHSSMLHWSERFEFKAYHSWHLSHTTSLQCQLWHTCILLLIWQIWRLIIVDILVIRPHFKRDLIQCQKRPMSTMIRKIWRLIIVLSRLAIVLVSSSSYDTHVSSSSYDRFEGLS